MKKEQPLGKAFSDAPLHDPTPFGKTADSSPAFASGIDRTRVAVPPHRAVKMGAAGNRGRTLGLRAQRGK